MVGMFESGMSESGMFENGMSESGGFQEVGFKKGVVLVLFRSRPYIVTESELRLESESGREGMTC